LAALLAASPRLHCLCTQTILDLCNRLWVLKNSFRGISRTKFARKLLNLRLPQAQKFTQITALVLFQQPQAIT